MSEQKKAEAAVDERDALRAEVKELMTRLVAEVKTSKEAKGREK